MKLRLQSRWLFSRQVAEFTTEQVHGVADDDVAGMKDFVVNLGGGEDLGLWEVMAEGGEKLL